MWIPLAGVLAVMLGAAFSAANAAANPIWEFNGTTLSGAETVLGSAIKATMTIPA
jgi:hypothetical protein